MRRLYITKRQTWFASVRANLFDATGTNCLELGNDLLLVSAGFSQEATLEAFTGRDDVAELPDPIFEGKTKLKNHIGSKKYSQAHHNALGTALGVTDEDTVIEVSAKAQAVCKAVRIGNLL